MNLKKMINKPIKELTVPELQELITESVKEALQNIIEDMNTTIYKVKEEPVAYKTRERRNTGKTIVKTKNVPSLEQNELMKLSENSFAEWDNSEDEIYDKM